MIRQFLTESLLLAAVGGLLSIVVAEVVLHGVLELLSNTNNGLTVAADLNMRVLGFSACATLVTGLLSALSRRFGDAQRRQRELERSWPQCNEFP